MAVQSSHERVPVSFPKLWVGYVIAASFLILEVVDYIKTPSPVKISPFLQGIFLAGLTYWFYCIYRLHKILAEVTNSTYPISPLKAAGYHFIPFFNLYWIFRWPNEIANFVNKRLSARYMAKGWIGFFLLLGMVLWQFDGALGLALTFSVGVYLEHKMKQAISSCRCHLY